MKSIAGSLALLALAASLAGCSSGSSNEVAELKEQVAQLTEENQKLKEQLGTGSQAADASASPSPASEPSTAPAPESLAIALNETITISDFADVTLAKAEFTSKVVPSNPGSFYSYYEVKDAANIYLDTVLNVKSLLTSKKSSEEFASVTVKYDGKYEYDSFSAIENDGGADLTYTNITSIEPLKSGTLHYIAELPKEASEDDKSVEIIVTLEGEDYVYKLK